MGNKRKSYYKNDKSSANKKAKLKFGDTIKLGPNMKGFLVTYNCKFTFIVNEAKKLIQQFSTNVNEDQTASNSKEGQSGDIEKELQKELETLNDRDKELKILDTGAKYTLFINFESINPNKIASAIFEHIEKTEKPLGRYVQRLLPVLNTCRAFMEDIEKCMKQTLDIHLTQSSDANTPGVTYSCVFKASNNGSLAREDIFKMVGAYFQSRNKSNKVNFDNPDYVILIHVVCSMCFISFVEKFFTYKRYNLIEMGCKFGNRKVDIGTSKNLSQEKISEEANANESKQNEETNDEELAQK